MSILDFKEISPPVKKTSKERLTNNKDLDQFEKFAEEFFEKIIGAKILKKISRGSDNGMDIKISLNDHIALVSCKHYAHSGNSVKSNDENPYEAMYSNGCTKFIGFYSTIPSSGLITKLEGYKNNKQIDFDYTIFKSSDIESTLLDHNNIKGWLLAARYFPKSYSNLFQRFVIPIEYYKEEDISELNNGYSLNGPYGFIYSGVKSSEKKKELLKKANDSLTSHVHITFFNAALKEAIDTFPGYFCYRQTAKLDNMTLADITPNWNAKLSQRYPNAPEGNVPILICSLWSFWNQSRALERYLTHQNEEITSLKTTSIPSLLTIGSTALFSNGIYRNIFSRLLAFAPATLEYYRGDDIVCFADENLSPKDWEFKNSEGLCFLYNNILK